MSTFFEKFGTRYTNYMIRQGRHQARRVLLSQSDLVLKDLGISRELLDAGIGNWPWKTTVDQPTPVTTSAGISRREEKRAIRELRALSNRELSDIGINRGDIVNAVKNGKSVAVSTELAPINLASLAKQSIGTASMDLDDTAANTAHSTNEAA